MPQLIELTQVCKEYPLDGGTVTGLDHVDLTVCRGDYLAIVGHSGSGKSTLMNILGCLDLPSAGEYRFHSQLLGPVRVDRSLGDRALSRLRNREIGFVFQNFQLIPQLTALENVELPLRYRGMGGPRRRELALQALERVGLGQRTGHFPAQLSGGQQQRVAVARAVAASPPLILADEPTGNLDRQAAQEIVLLLQQLHREGKTVVLITHDEKIARSAPRRVRIQDGKVVPG